MAQRSALKGFKRICRLLYAKYVREYSPFEVNIGSACRKEFNRLMADEAQWMDEVEMLPDDLMNIFDDNCRLPSYNKNTLV